MLNFHVCPRSEDAEAALSKIKSLDGRKLFVAYANKKKKEKKKKPKVKIEEKAEDESDKDSSDEEEEEHIQKPQSADTEMTSMTKIYLCVV